VKPAALKGVVTFWITQNLSFRGHAMSQPAETKAPIADKARQFAPVVWLIGKVQSGKTSIIRALTRSTDAEVGSGFRACTRTARVFDFPDDAPIIRFLDTSGLGEAAYEPSADIAFCESRAHLVLAVAKALDLQQKEVLDVLSAVRDRHPDWPIVVAQTSLHEAYAAGEKHVKPYPYGDEASALVPDTLARALSYQRALFRALPGDGGLRGLWSRRADRGAHCRGAGRGRRRAA
jgi:hypothetical protein